MKLRRHFDIEVIKYQDGVHDLEFHVDDRFFELFEPNELVSKGNLTIAVHLDKGANLIELSFDIHGTVNLICDRSLEAFDYPLELEESILLKYGSEEKEIDENIWMITRDTPKINIAQLIYEYVLLGIPPKKIHPDYRNELDEEDLQVEGGYVYLDTDQQLSEHTEKNQESQGDPRWELLKKLKEKKN